LFLVRLFLGLLVAVAVVALADSRAAASGAGPVVHEPIPPDPREDLAMHVALDGDLPAALQTPSGVVGAPDPRLPPSPSDSAYGAGGEHMFEADRDTKRPEVTGYDEPFTPSTAPFKRLEAYDAVRDDYRLYVRDERLMQLPMGAPPGLDDEAFYADLVVDVGPDKRVRIPSVGPGARIVRARLGVGADDVSFHVLHDGADNWFLQAYGARRPLRARLVMELAIARGAFGGQTGDPSWGDLLLVPPLSDNIARDAAAVRGAIGVSREMRPREALGKLVSYFRGFADSEDEPTGRGSIYLDLALSKKGVCRHRAFAFLVTAQSLGLPTRMVLNEAHAWVEVHDGVMWRRIDLGGAGHMTNPASSALPERMVYKPPPDSFSWPQGSERGDDMVADARSRASSSRPPGGAGGKGGDDRGAPGQEGTPGGAGSASGPEPGGPERDERPPSALSLAVVDADAHRGAALHVRGDVRADGDACAHVAVELWLRDARSARMYLLGTVATGDDGVFSGGIVVPGTTPLGDYDVVARTPGDARCGVGASDQK
jgi:transglutaminase-like putative cysteine protease